MPFKRLLLLPLFLLASLQREYKKSFVKSFSFLPFENLFSNFGLKKITKGYQSFSSSNERNIIKFDNIIPTAIAKNIISGMNLYGWLVISVVANNNGFVNNIPEIIIEILFAYLFFFETKNNPIIIGNKNITTKPSKRIWYVKDVNAIQNSSQSHVESNPEFEFNVVDIPIIITPIIIIKIIIFFLIEISEFNIKNIEYGINAAVNNFENNDNTYASGERYHVLCSIKYIDNK